MAFPASGGAGAIGPHTEDLQHTASAGSENDKAADAAHAGGAAATAAATTPEGQDQNAAESGRSQPENAHGPSVSGEGLRHNSD